MLRKIAKLILLILLCVLSYFLISLVFTESSQSPLIVAMKVFLIIFLAGILASHLRLDFEITSISQDITLIEKTLQFFDNMSKVLMEYEKQLFQLIKKLIDRYN